MKETAGRISTSRKAKVTPTARASMLVATASRNISFTARDASSWGQPGSSSFSETASRIMLTPMMPRSTKAIQWSMAVIRSRNWTPRR